MDLKDMRREYLSGGLTQEDLQSDPIDQFQQWMREAIDLGIKDVTAMTLATVSTDGQPSQRIVLLKQVDKQGFVFFTNYASKKAGEIAANAKVSLHFPWHNIDRQVKICGQASKVSTAESLKYFLSRPQDSQIAAWASKQSRTISSKALLLQQVAAIRNKFQSGNIPLPDFWGGYRVKPYKIEFWQGGEHRLHDRLEYTRTNTCDAQGSEWTIQRLSP